MERLHVEDVVLVLKVGSLKDEVQARFDDGLPDSDRSVARLGQIQLEWLRTTWL